MQTVSINMVEGLAQLNTDVDNLTNQVNNLNSADIAARKEIMALKMQLELANKRTAVGYYDAFVDTSGVDTGNTTATFDSTNKLYTFTGSKTLKMGDQVYDQFKAMDLSLYPKKINKVTVSGAVANSKTVVLSASDKTLVIGDKLFIGGAENNIDGLVNNSVTYDKTNPVTAATGDYSTAGNGGRKLVRLNSGNLYSVVKTSGGYLIRKSTDKGATWADFKNALTDFGSSFQDVALATDGTKLFVLLAYSNFAVTYLTLNESETLLASGNLTTSETALGNCSLTLGTDGNLHAAWVSKNATYPNSFNIRYAKGTINGDGSVTWGAVEQVTIANTSNTDYSNPCVTSKILNGKPLIISQTVIGGGATNRIMATYYNGTVWTSVIIYDGGTYLQRNPSATVDSNGTIHVAWDGTESGDGTAGNVRYSKSTDVTTWSTPVKLTTGNTYTQAQPSIACDSNNDIHVAFIGVTAANPNFTNIRTIKSTSGVWGAITEVTAQNAVSMNYPSLCDNYRNFEKPLMIYKEGTTAIKFYGKWTEQSGYTLTMQNAVTLASGATLPIVDLNAYQNDVAMTLKSVDTDKFNYSISGLTTTTAKVKVTGKDTQLDGLAYGVA